MAISLTIIVCLLSAGILAGRIYEILKLTDPQTGFFVYKGIVLNPAIIAVFTVIVICCGIIILGDNKEVKPFFSKTSKIIAVAAGCMFLVYGVMALQSSKTAVFMICGAVALITTGIAGLKPKSGIADIAAVIFTVVFVVGLCLDIIVFDVNTIHNTFFIKNALAYISLGMFLLCVLKNVYSPSAKSPMLLYITGMLAFVLCGIMNIADIAVMVMGGNSVLPDLFAHAGFAFAGFFALDNAVSVIPSKGKESAVTKNAAEEKEQAEHSANVQQINITSEHKNTDNEVQIQKTSVFNTAEKANKKILFSSTGITEINNKTKATTKVVYKRPKN